MSYIPGSPLEQGNGALIHTYPANSEALDCLQGGVPSTEVEQVDSGVLG